jgi:hypothetical protein
MTTLYGGPMPDDFTDGEVLTAVDFNRVKNYWVSNTFPDEVASANAQDGDVVFVLDNAEMIVSPTLVALWDTDIDVDNLATGQALVYDATAGMWINSTVDIASDLSSLQAQIDSNTANISANQTNITNNTTNISNLSGTISSLSTTVDTHTSQITALEEGGGGGGGSATLWSGTVTGITNGDQQTVQVAAGEPINATITAANKTPNFVYTGDKVVGGNLDGGYAILSREFNYPDMPAFDPTGGIAQDGADIACWNNGTDNRLYWDGSPTGGIANSIRSSTVAKADAFNGLCYFNVYDDESTTIQYALISDSAVYGVLITPATVKKIMSYADYLIAPQADARTIYYYDYNVQDWGILTGFEEEIQNQTGLLSSSWNSGSQEFWATPHLFVPSDGKLHALVMGCIESSPRSTAFLHLVYETDANPLIGTWTTVNVKELAGQGDNSASPDSYARWSPTWDCAGTMVRYEISSNVSNNANNTGWWDFSDNSIVLTQNIYSQDNKGYWAHPMSFASNSARPYSSCNISRGSENLILTVLNHKTSALTQIELTSFPVSTYSESGGERTMTKGVLDYKNGYYVAPLINKVTSQAEIWKFDMFGQAVKLWESTEGVFDSSGFPEMNMQQGRASNSGIVAFMLPLNECRTIFWVDLEAS